MVNLFIIFCYTKSVRGISMINIMLKTCYFLSCLSCISLFILFCKKKLTLFVLVFYIIGKFVGKLYTRKKWYI